MNSKIKKLAGWCRPRRCADRRCIAAGTAFAADSPRRAPRRRQRRPRRATPRIQA